MKRKIDNGQHLKIGGCCPSCQMLMGIVMECKKKIIIKYNPRSVNISESEINELPQMLCQDPNCYKKWQKTNKAQICPCIFWANCDFVPVDFACTEEDSKGCGMAKAKAEKKSLAA